MSSNLYLIWDWLMKMTARRGQQRCCLMTLESEVCFVKDNWLITINHDVDVSLNTRLSQTFLSRGMWRLIYLTWERFNYNVTWFQRGRRVLKEIMWKINNIVIQIVLLLGHIYIFLPCYPFSLYLGDVSLNGRSRLHYSLYMIHKCCCPVHVCCTLFSVGNKVSTITKYYHIREGKDRKEDMLGLKS